MSIVLRSILSTCWPCLDRYSSTLSNPCWFVIAPTDMLLSAIAAAWCSLGWARAALKRLRMSQHFSIATRQESGSCGSCTGSSSMDMLCTEQQEPWCGNRGSSHCLESIQSFNPVGPTNDLALRKHLAHSQFCWTSTTPRVDRHQQMSGVHKGDHSSCPPDESTTLRKQSSVLVSPQKLSKQSNAPCCLLCGVRPKDASTRSTWLRP